MTDDVIDLRSDTVTLPSTAMRRAMAEAELGDDVYGEDPTVNRLEAMAAGRLGKEAAVFVSSGTQGNLTALLSHCGRGDEYIAGHKAHLYRAEAGGAAVLGGIQPQLVPLQPDGTLALDDLETAIKPDDSHYARTRLICLENTQAYAGGLALPLEYLAGVRALAGAHDLRVHLDGARVFNAALALNVDVTAITQHVDSVSFCLSKGLAAPVGSLLCGPAAFVAEARRVRKLLGGGMRQAGVLAAAGIVALSEMVERLADDHRHARQLAEGLVAVPGVALNLEQVQTNIVYFSVDPGLGGADGFRVAMVRRGVRLSGSDGRIRAVTHYGIESEHIERVLALAHEVSQSATPWKKVISNR
jgi:threonine aldolase